MSGWRTRTRFKTSPNTAGVYLDDHHLVFFRRREPWGSSSAWGFHYRVRLRDQQWRHTILRLGERGEPIPGGAGCWTCEIQQYRTRKVASNTGGNRTSIKRFLRVKLGLGGKAEQ